MSTNKIIFNKINIFLAECYENNTIIPAKNIIDMFTKIFKNDITYIKHCPDGLENSLIDLVKCINEQQNSKFKDELKVFLIAYYDTISYEKIKNKDMPLKDKDKFWYKALLSEFVLQNMLFKNNSIQKFKVEYIQIGSLIKNYYSEKCTDKSKVLKNIIKSKLLDIYSRYDYVYDLPTLCI